MINVYGGETAEDQESFAQRIKIELNCLSELNERYKTAGDYVVGFIKQVLQPHFRPPVPHPFSGFPYHTQWNPGFFESFVTDSDGEAFDELLVENWFNVSDLLRGEVYPLVKKIYQDLLLYEIPVAAEGPVHSLLVREVPEFCCGAIGLSPIRTAIPGQRAHEEVSGPAVCCAVRQSKFFLAHKPIPTLSPITTKQPMLSMFSL